MARRPPTHQPRKRFGQNFLHDQGIIARLESAISPVATDHLVEIGPGLGALTEVLLQSDCRLDAIELDRHVELVAIRPSSYGWPPVARAGLSQAMQYALEKGSAGEETVWTSSGVEVRVTIKPVAKYTRGDGKTCRTYVQTWDLTEGKHQYPGAACRSPSGKWQIPGLEESADASEVAKEGLS